MENVVVAVLVIMMMMMMITLYNSYTGRETNYRFMVGSGA